MITLILVPQLEDYFFGVLYFLYFLHFLYFASEAALDPIGQTSTASVETGLQI